MACIGQEGPSGWMGDLDEAQAGRSPVSAPASTATDAPSPPPSGASPGAGPTSEYPPGPTASLVSLFFSLLGFIGVALILYEFKFHPIHSSLYSLDSVPTRILFVLSLASAAAPFYVTTLRRVPVLYLLPPVFLIVFLYPLFSPYGLPYSRDAIYNLQFAQSILTTHTWHPLVDVSAQAQIYSYYPGGAVYNALVPSLTGFPLNQTFLWAYELLRLLVIPCAIYAFCVRLFGSRPAPLAVLFYLTVPSIEMNVPTQTDFAVLWFILAIVLLGFLATSSTTSETGFLRTMFIVASLMVVVSHYVTTYLLIGMLFGLAFLPWILRRRDPYPNLRSFTMFLVVLTMLLVWVALVSRPVILKEYSILVLNVHAVFAPGVAKAAAAPPGVTFPLYELVWIGAAIVVIGGLAMLTLTRTYRFEQLAFITFGIITSLLVGIFSIPFLSTGFSFLALREFEFVGVFFAPAGAWFITNRLLRPRIETPVSPPRHLPRLASRFRVPPKRAVWLAVALCVIVVGGGELVPLSTRDQFSQVPNAVSIDSPLFINQTAYDAGEWASAHMDPTYPVWGDYLAYSVFGGFAHFQMVWDSYDMFSNATFNEPLLLRVFVGQYVVVDSYMTNYYAHNKTFAPPMFFGSKDDQPSGQIQEANIAKFADHPYYFELIYANAVFTVYQVVNIPCNDYPGVCIRP